MRPAALAGASGSQTPAAGGAVSILPMSFTPAEELACRRLIELALEEDLGKDGDVTSQAVIPADQTGRAVLRARSPGVVAGLPAAGLVFAAVDPGVSFQPLLSHGADGTAIPAGGQLAAVTGPLRAILAGERIALNFLQHLSGIATLTRRYVDAAAGMNCKILDTRKTLPGWRLLAKYAVRCGGGHNHRMGLYDGILIKDNHWAALRQRATDISLLHTVLKLGEVSLPLEMEVDTLAELDQALACRVDIILLDNMTLEQLREAVRRRNAVAPEVLLEASGGVTLETVRAIAETGVDRISVGALYYE